MAIAPTGAFYKALSFDNTSSRNYGVYITGRAVFNAPERAVEMISIPGRNGSFAMDQGRFENIEVTYPAGIFAETEEDFAQAISDFRNYLCSKKGYCRLTDEYNPDEYRMAVYKAGLEVDPARLIAGEFDITFECKPQRWLMSGESAVTIANSGDTITNPTLFESSPLLEIDGYGTIGFNGYEIELEQAPIVDVVLAEKGKSYLSNPYVISFNENLVSVGDVMRFNRPPYHDVEFYCGGYSTTGGNVSFTDSNPSVTSITSIGFCFDGQVFTVGTPKTVTNTRTYTTASYPAETPTWTSTIVYDGNHTFTFSTTLMSTAHFTFNYPTTNGSVEWSTLIATTQAFGSQTFIDCDLGEAYMIKDGVPISLNEHIDLGSDLPKLASGANTITYDNTITNLKIEPHWWKV